MNRIGVFKFNNIGDVLLMTPVFEALRATWPRAHIIAVVNDYTAGMLVGNPHVDETLELPRTRMKRGSTRQRLLEEWRFAFRIRDLRCDLAINVTSGDRGLIYALLCGAHTRIAFDKGSWKKTRWQRWLHTHLAAWPDNEEHQVTRQLRLLESLGIPPAPRALHLAPTAGEIRWAHRRLPPLEEGRIHVHVHPVARWLFKCWDSEKFAAVIDWLTTEWNARVILSSGPDPGEMKKAREILERCRHPPLSFVGDTSLRELTALMHRSDLFIGVDTAPMHMAAALGKPVIALFGPTGVDWHPWCEKREVVLAPCRCKRERRDHCQGRMPRECLAAITVEMVQVAVRRHLRTHPRAPFPIP